MSTDWSREPLGEVLMQVERPIVPIPGTRYRQLGVRLWGEGAYERETIDGAATKYATLSKVEADDVVVNKIWARNGSVAVVQPALTGCVVSGEFPTFRPIPDRIHPRWVHWLTKTPGFWAQCDEKSRGTSGKNRIKPEQFLRVEIPLPPLEEQRRIAARIQELAAKIEAVTYLRKKASEEGDVLLGAIVANLFRRAPRHWSVHKLGDFVVDVRYGTSEKTHDDAAGLPILRMGNIQDGHITNSNLKYLHLTDRDKKVLMLKGGDILVNRTNSAELVGKCAVFDLAGDYAFASYLIRLRLDQQRAEPALVAAYINSPIGREYMVAAKRQMTGQANVNATKLQALPIALPPIVEQRRILAWLGDLQMRLKSLRQQQTESGAEFDALLPAILDRALKGEL